MISRKIGAVLFDLDGTLADTALDLGYALNELRRLHGHPPLPHATLRPYASHGTQGLLDIGFNLSTHDPAFPALREEYLALYTANLCRHTRLFDGMSETLANLESRKIPWGVVTNKPARFTDPLMSALGLSQRAASIISGDTCPHPKPHPEPLLCASREIGIPAASCAYVGDAHRDMQAAINAGMLPILASYGYLGKNDHPETWSASHMIQNPLDLLNLLNEMA
ncbi:MAG: HAD-IA family hydrolase [Sulfuricellaceae bacterium]|nr:HAD-IA family hydrolase [Sulfuricellaceae bacterium]